MTSKKQVAHCYVYITLPGQINAVTAGRFEHSVHPNGTQLGRFVYGKSYLARPDKVEFDPVELKLIDRTLETTRLQGIFGALRDAGPDHWGRRVIERHLQKAHISEIEYLLHSPEDRAGALSFGLSQTPPAPKRVFNQTLDLLKLQRIAESIMINENLESEKPAAVQVSELLLIGTSMGGAIPKVVVEDKAGLWIAKMNRPDDQWNNARVEHAMLLLARSCGLATAESRVIQVADSDILLVKRFDREKKGKAGYLRSRMISGLTLLQAEDTYQSREKWSYLLLVEELRRVCANPNRDACELFRRMCFNSLISNIDDHPRNHALIAKENEWELSPAYDLTPSVLIGKDRRDLAMVVGDFGRYANAQNILSQCRRFLMEPEVASGILNDMEKKVKKTWYQVARKAGVSEKNCEMISSAFVYSGFHNQLR